MKGIWDNVAGTFERGHLQQGRGHSRVGVLPPSRPPSPASPPDRSSGVRRARRSSRPCCLLGPCGSPSATCPSPTWCGSGWARCLQPRQDVVDKVTSKAGLHVPADGARWTSLAVPWCTSTPLSPGLVVPSWSASASATAVRKPFTPHSLTLTMVGARCCVGWFGFNVPVRAGKPTVSPPWPSSTPSPRHGGCRAGLGAPVKPLLVARPRCWVQLPGAALAWSPSRRRPATSASAAVW